jgi:hypothetical protein
MSARRKAQRTGLRATGGRIQEYRRVLRRLAVRGARLVQDDRGEFALYGSKNNYAKPVLRLSRDVGEALIADGLIMSLRGLSGSYEVSAEGLSFLRRAEAAAAPFEAQHREPGTRYIGEGDGQGRTYAVNLTESPLTWLASRKGADGAPFLAPAQLEAGERLREDFTRAGLMARITVDWETPLTSGRGGDRGLTLGEAALAARQRVKAALIAVGAEFEEVLLSVCCHLQGLEEVERAQGRPPRTGKIVLKMGLARLARHYGLIRAPAGSSPLRHWSP